MKGFVDILQQSMQDQPTVDTAPAIANELRDVQAGPHYTQFVGAFGLYPPDDAQLSPEHLDYIMAMSQQAVSIDLQHRNKHSDN